MPLSLIALHSTATALFLVKDYIPTVIKARTTRVQVRSCSLDTWLQEQVAFMGATGNQVAAAHWEATLPSDARPLQSDNAALQVWCLWQ